MSVSENDKSFYGRIAESAVAKNIDKKVYEWPRIAAAAGVAIGVAVGGSIGWASGFGSGIASRYFSAEEKQKRIDMADAEAAKVKAAKDQAAAEAARVAAEEKAAQEKREADEAVARAAEQAEREASRAQAEKMLTPEIKERVFALADPDKAVCYPQGYGFEAVIDSSGDIIAFQDKTVFKRDPGWGTSNNTIRSSCIRGVNLSKYWQNEGLSEGPSSKHFDILKSVYALCGGSVQMTPMTAFLKDGNLAVEFNIATNIFIDGENRYPNFWNCVNDNPDSPRFVAMRGQQPG